MIAVSVRASHYLGTEHDRLELAPAQARNPQRRMRVATSPPVSAAALPLACRARPPSDEFALQTCTECGHLQYPPRDACSKCLSIELKWRDVSPMGRFIAIRRPHQSNALFPERLAGRVGTVQLDAGPSTNLHLQL